MKANSFKYLFRVVFRDVVIVRVGLVVMLTLTNYMISVPAHTYLCKLIHTSATYPVIGTQSSDYRNVKMFIS